MPDTDLHRRTPGLKNQHVDSIKIDPTSSHGEMGVVRGWGWGGSGRVRVGSGQVQGWGQGQMVALSGQRRLWN